MDPKNPKTPENDNAQHDTQTPANDNAGPKPPQHPQSLYTPERVAFLLALAGYDPETIPVGERIKALHVAWAVKGGLYDVPSIAEATDLGCRQTLKLVRLLRFAAKPGTKCA